MSASDPLLKRLLSQADPQAVQLGKRLWRLLYVLTLATFFFPLLTVVEGCGKTKGTPITYTGFGLLTKSPVFMVLVLGIPLLLLALSFLPPAQSPLGLGWRRANRWLGLELQAGGWAFTVVLMDLFSKKTIEPAGHVLSSLTGVGLFLSFLSAVYSWVVVRRSPAGQDYLKPGLLLQLLLPGWAMGVSLVALIVGAWEDDQKLQIIGMGVAYCLPICLSLSLLGRALRNGEAFAFTAAILESLLLGILFGIFVAGAVTEGFDQNLALGFMIGLIAAFPFLYTALLVGKERRDNQQSQAVG